jgi:hypothetical protein
MDSMHVENGEYETKRIKEKDVFALPDRDWWWHETEKKEEWRIECACEQSGLFRYLLFSLIFRQKRVIDKPLKVKSVTCGRGRRAKSVQYLVYKWSVSAIRQVQGKLEKKKEKWRARAPCYSFSQNDNGKKDVALVASLPKYFPSIFSFSLSIHFLPSWRLINWFFSSQP